MKYKICFEGEFMSQVQGSFQLNVLGAQQPPPPALSLQPQSGNLPDETEGADVGTVEVATVSGGVPPYNYQFSGQPEGVEFFENDNGDGSFSLVLEGTPAAGSAAGSPYSLSVSVTDSDTSQSAPQTSTRRALTVQPGGKRK